MEHSPLSMVIDTAMTRTREMLMMQIMTTISLATTDGTLSPIYGGRYSNDEDKDDADDANNDNNLSSNYRWNTLPYLWW